MTTTQPKSCSTCLYSYTHEQCPGCISQAANGPDQYIGWVQGDGRARLLDLQNDGRLNIWLGMGEAQVNARWTLDETIRRLQDVAERCGYRLDQSPTRGQRGSSYLYPTLALHTPDGTFTMMFDRQGLLWVGQEGDWPVTIWHRPGS